MKMILMVKEGKYGGEEKELPHCTFNQRWLRKKLVFIDTGYDA